MIKTALVTDAQVEISEQLETTTVSIDTKGITHETLQRGESATVVVNEETVTLRIGGNNSDSPGSASPGGLKSVSEEGKTDGSVLSYDGGLETWIPTNLQRGQIYDGGNF